MDSSAWDRHYAGSELLWSATANQWVEELATQLPCGRALDLAGGEGRNALWLVERGWRATVVDFSQVGLDRAEGLALERFGPAGRAALTTVRADLLSYRPEAQSFDLVLVVYLQVPEKDRRSVLQAAATAVAPGGVMLVVAHDFANLRSGVGGPQDPAVLYTAEDVAADLVGTGLAVERCESVLRAVRTDMGPRNAIDALLVARRANASPTDHRPSENE